MIKTVLTWRNDVADALAYSDKVVGTYRSDRSINFGTIVEDRYIAPSDLIKQMAETCPIRFAKDGLASHETNNTPTISTVPMPALMQALSYRNFAKFDYMSGTNIHATIKDCDAYVSLLVPDPAWEFSRMSLTGDDLIIECTNIIEDDTVAFDIVTRALPLLGINRGRLLNVSKHTQRYAKIAPIDDEERKAFIFWATNNYQIYSLGRFATWRPGLLLDDLVNDVRLIRRWIDRSDRYGLALHGGR